jgi:hypothetical protein
MNGRAYSVRVEGNKYGASFGSVLSSVIRSWVIAPNSSRPLPSEADTRSEVTRLRYRGARSYWLDLPHLGQLADARVERPELTESEPVSPD